MNNELPYQTYERVTGKKWTGGNSPDVQSAYKQYGITAPAGSAQANLALQKALVGGGTQPKIPTVQTSDMAADAARKAEESLNAATQNRANQQTTTDTTKTKTKPTKKSAIADLVGAEAPDYFTQRKTELDSTLDSLNTSIQNQWSTLNDVDADTQSLIDSIKGIYNSRIEEQKKINAAMLGSTRVSGIVSGRERYASTIQDSIIGAEETAGLQRITSLQAEMNNLIQTAKTAAKDKKTETLYKSMDRYDKLKADRDKLIQDQYQRALDLERLAIQKAQEERAQIKADIEEEEKMAENLVSGVVDLPEKEMMAEIKKIAEEYGRDTNFLLTAVNKLKQEKLKGLGADVRSWEYMKQNYGYTGSLFQFQAAKQAATRASSGGSVIDREDIKRFNLPSELMGRSERDIILDLGVSRVPDWFKAFVQKYEPEKQFDDYGWQSIWNTYRGSDDMMVLRNTIDIDKVNRSDPDYVPSSVPATTSSGATTGGATTTEDDSWDSGLIQG